jgi:hypothetical protein
MTITGQSDSLASQIIWPICPRFLWAVVGSLEKQHPSVPAGQIRSVFYSVFCSGWLSVQPKWSRMFFQLGLSMESGGSQSC